MMKGFRFVALFFCVAVFLVAARAEEGGIDFTGAWILDVKASRSEAFDQILKAYGLNWFERSTADRITVHQTITQQGTNILQMKMHTIVRDGEETMIMDRAWRNVKDASDRPVRMRSYWNKEGTIALADIEPLDKKNSGLRMTLRRWLSEDQQTMYMQHQIVQEGQEPITAMRILRRVEEE